jgi:hypothetical protein
VGVIHFALATLLAAGLMSAPDLRDGRHDFDFEIGSWTFAPSGYGHVVRKLWNGATIAQLVIQKPAPHVRGSLLSLYNPSSREWNVYWADANDGTLSPPLAGSFHNGIGTFIGHDTVDGRPVMIRVVYSHVTQRSFQTVQSVSQDNGRTWAARTTRLFTRIGSARSS